MNYKTELMWLGFLLKEGIQSKNLAENYDQVKVLAQIQKLAHKHQIQCENSCNGYGIVKGNKYYNGKIDDYAKREYGHNVKSAYDGCDMENGETVFDKELEKIQDKIVELVKSINLGVKFQHDPRGATVRLLGEGTKEIFLP